MPEWLSQNIGTIIVCAVIVSGCALLVWSLIRDKKRGKSLCGGHCAGCAMAGRCHSAKVTAPAESAPSDGTSATEAVPTEAEKEADPS